LPDVVVSTIAGSDVPGDADGYGPFATFNNPVNLLRDGAGGFYIADFDNGLIRVIDVDQNVTRLTTDAGFARPFGLAFAGTGELLVQTDFDENGTNAGDDGGVIWGVDLLTGIPVPIATQVGRPRGLVSLPNGLVVVSDILRHDIRLFDPATATFTPLAGLAGCPDFADAVDGADARFNRPYGLALTASGDVLVADQNNHRIRLIDMPSGAVSTFAGDGTSDLTDGFLADARFSSPQDLAIDAAGNIFVSDHGNHRIRRIGVGGVVETVAGSDQEGFADGDGETARFAAQEGIEVTPDGLTVFVADGTEGVAGLPYHRIRKVELQ
jgi:DNA-binding beta-propeller fold protein YncE